MSHFALLVITDDKPTDESLESILAPFQEVESTGNEAYMQNIDKLDDARAAFDTDESGRTFDDFCCSWFGLTRVLEDDEPDTSDQHKYGWVRVKGGEVVEVVDRTNPRSKWDWWVVGGRWSGWLIPKADARETRSGRRGTFGTVFREAGVDIARKSDVDFEAMRAEARKNASARWVKVRSVLGDTIEGFLPWDHVREVMFPGDIDAARNFFNDQPARKALSEAAKTNRDLEWESVDNYILDHDEFVKQAAQRSTVLFAALKDDKWAERGEMGWFGCVSNEKNRDEWTSGFNAMLNELPDDAWLTVVDCHI